MTLRMGRRVLMNGVLLLVLDDDDRLFVRCWEPKTRQVVNVRRELLTDAQDAGSGP